MVSVVPGKRTAENIEALVQDLKRRTARRPMNLIASDEYRPYKTAILQAYGRTVKPRRTGRRGRPHAPYKGAPQDLKYATVHKTRGKGRVIKIDWRVIFGTVAAVMAARAVSRVSKKINTAFVERHNGTDRHHNARKSRRTYRVSKNWQIPEAVTYLTMVSYNFCWPVRTLRQKVAEQWQSRTPAMAAGLADHVWSLSEWLSFPAVQRT